MKRKKIFAQIICCFAVMTAFTLSAHAQITEQSCTTKGQVVTFEGFTDNKDGIITYTVCEGTGDNGDIFGGKNLYFIGETAADTDGNFNIQFSLEDSGDYVLRMKDSAGDILDKPIKYLSIDDNGKILIEEINSGDDNRIKKAVEDFDFSFDGKKYSDIKTNAMENWIVNCTKNNIPYADREVFEKNFNEYMSLYYINNSNAAAIASECGKYAELLGLSQNTNVSKFANSATDAQKRALVKQLSSKPAQNAQMLVKAITDALNTNSNQGGGSSGGGSGSSGGSNSSGSKGTGFVGVQSPLTGNGNSGNNDNSQEVQKGFSDLEQASWAREAVETLAERGIVSGDGDGRFRPNDEVTREEFVKMIAEAIGIADENAMCSFLDVFENDWFYSYVGAAQKAEIIRGISEDMFGVHLKITRQDAAVIIERAAEYMNKTLETKRDFTDFTDGSMIADYAADSVKHLYESGIINGMDDGSFKPKNTCTRAEAAKMIYGLL